MDKTVTTSHYSHRDRHLYTHTTHTCAHTDRTSCAEQWMSLRWPPFLLLYHDDKIISWHRKCSASGAFESTPPNTCSMLLAISNNPLRSWMTRCSLLQRCQFNETKGVFTQRCSSPLLSIMKLLSALEALLHYAFIKWMDFTRGDDAFDPFSNMDYPINQLFLFFKCSIQ